MYWSKVISILLLVGLAFADNEAPTELVIKTDYMPDDCVLKAQKGDQIKVHYVSTPSESSAARCNDLAAPDWNPVCGWQEVRLKVSSFPSLLKAWLTERICQSRPRPAFPFDT